MHVQGQGAADGGIRQPPFESILFAPLIFAYGRAVRACTVREALSRAACAQHCTVQQLNYGAQNDIILYGFIEAHIIQGHWAMLVILQRCYASLGRL